MIKSLKIQNVQSHKETNLSFSPGVNMIIGKSDNGKSAILNSLFWAMYNRPLGDSHRNWDGGDMSVSVQLDDGTVTISRDKQTEYTIKKGKKKSVFKSSGQNPPEEVTNLFNMDRKINVQRQLERDAPIFLISESPGEVAAFLNKVAGLYKIDETVSKGKSDLRKTKTDLDYTKDQIKTKQKELQKYAGIDDLYTLVSTCDVTAKKQANNKRILNEINHNLQSIGEIVSCLNELTEKIHIKEYIEAALQWIGFKKQCNEKMDKIDSILVLIEHREGRQKELQSKLNLKKDLKKIESKMDTVVDKQVRFDSIFECLDSIERLEERQKEKRASLEKQEKVFHKLMPEQCPLCGK